MEPFAEARVFTEGVLWGWQRDRPALDWAWLGVQIAAVGALALFVVHGDDAWDGPPVALVIDEISLAPFGLEHSLWRALFQVEGLA